MTEEKKRASRRASLEPAKQRPMCEAGVEHGGKKSIAWYTIIATWFGSGHSKFVSGTVGSLATLPFAYIIHINFGWVGLAVAGILAFVIGTLATHYYLKHVASNSDPKEVVIDEVAGQFLTLMFLAPTLEAYVLGFFLFRGFDVLKPGPIGWADRKIKGAYGVMIDDIFAGLAAAYTPLVLWWLCDVTDFLPGVKVILNSVLDLYVP